MALEDVEDGSELVFRVPKRVTYEEKYPKAMKTPPMKAMKVMKKKASMKVAKEIYYGQVCGGDDDDSEAFK